MILQAGVGTRFVDVSLSDSEFIEATRGLFVGTAGDVKITARDERGDTTVILQNHPIGYAPISVVKVWSTGTAASDIVAIY